MLLSNKLIYSDRLKCGSEAVASQSLLLPNESFVQTLHKRSPCENSGCWMSKLMNDR